MQRRLVLWLGGAILCLAAASGTAASSVQDAVDLISLSSYQGYLDNSLYTHTGMSRGLGGSQHDAARTNIVNQFTAFGLTVNLDPFAYGGSTYYNVVGVRPGSVRPNDVYVLGAHYDSAGNPGADDNASGVAGVLETARVLSQFNFEATVVFIAFDREEQGLIGSTAYANAHKNDAIRGMVSLDMIAYNPASAGQRAYVYGRDASLPIKQALAGALSQYSGGITPVIGGDTPYSDHAPFESQGFQACLLIEYAVWSNPLYHKSSDTVDTPAYIDYGFARDMTRGAAGWVAGAAGLDTTPAALAWAGGAGATWDVGLAANWSAAGHAAWFHQGDLVTFGDAAGVQPVTIAGTVRPASVVVSNAMGNIVIGGTGAIAGGCGLTKSGAGTLLLSAANTYDGATAVSAGTLLVANTSGSATGTGPVTVGAATLGGTGFINGPVTLTGDSTLTSTGTLTINNTLTIQGLANQLAAGTVLTSGDVTIESGAEFIINSTLGGGTGSLIIYGTLMGKGTINKPLSLEAGGVLSPGEPSTIQGMAQMVVGGGPQTLAFEIGAASPNYASPANSVNDLVRLTDAAAPFADAAGGAAALGADTVIDVYFLWSNPALGEYKAEFFAATDFSDDVAGATYEYWRLDPRGSRYHNGNFYSPLDPSLVDWSVVPETADFGGVSTNGYITEFTVVPEPATLSLVALGGLAALLRRRRFCSQ